MTTTKASAKNTVKTCYLKYGKDFYRKIGAMGGNPMLMKIHEEKKKELNR